MFHIIIQRMRCREEKNNDTISISYSALFEKEN